MKVKESNCTWLTILFSTRLSRESVEEYVILSIDTKEHLTTGSDSWNSLTAQEFYEIQGEKIALSADTEANFYPFAVARDDQTVLRFLWRESPDLEIELYQYQRNMFGAKCTSTCANYALRQNAKTMNTNFLVPPWQ